LFKLFFIKCYFDFLRINNQVKGNREFEQKMKKKEGAKYCIFIEIKRVIYYPIHKDIESTFIHCLEIELTNERSKEQHENKRERELKKWIIIIPKD